MDKFHSLIQRFPYDVAQDLSHIPNEIWKTGEEIRFRVGQNATMISGGKEYRLHGKILENIDKDILNNIINRFLKYSEYAFPQEMAGGFITISDGHRVGFCGQAVMDGHHISTIRNISSLNVRIAKDLPQVGESVIPMLMDQQQHFLNTLIISPPGCGKTTLLRSLIRILSHQGYQISVCDERGEISGIGPDGFSFDLGPRTDVMSHCSKESGMRALIRSMGPEIIATDEISTDKDILILKQASCSGIKLLVTMHGQDLQDIYHSYASSLITEGFIQRIVILTDHPKRGAIQGIWRREQI